MSHLATRIEETFPHACLKAMAKESRDCEERSVARCGQIFTGRTFLAVSLYCPRKLGPAGERGGASRWSMNSILFELVTYPSQTRVPEMDAVVQSLTDLWKGADFMEREVYGD